ncbi:apoptosis regulatory protein Siva-like [Daphnia pulex]|uniref:apoptosis regulatory protein Siva-like n=1 Tax=Daphnia pulex TaxID=6669 RepID=UPI001EDD5A93|nr:apoptosis regulatory protein Siva-like [Daphnia pulex]
MTKRPVSELDWGDALSHCPQSKIQVGNREINQGICSESNMKAVYRKTLNLLFQGSKAKPNQLETTHPIPTQPPTNLPKYSQTIITLDGRISPQQIDGQPPSAFVNATLPHSCMSCSSAGSFIALERCKFCEGMFCDKCFKLCMSCGGEFCSKCSIQTYSRDECSICLSCATKRGNL